MARYKFYIVLYCIVHVSIYYYAAFNVPCVSWLNETVNMT